MNENRIIFPITPQTGVKISPNEMVLFRLPEQCSVACGLPRRSKSQPEVVVATMRKKYPELWEALGGVNWKPRQRKKIIRYGCPHMITQEGLGRKRRIERMIKYREDLLEMALDKKFELPVSGWSLYFYLPMPKHWPEKKRNLLHGQPNMAKPDVDNMYKLFSDALSKVDERVAQLSGLGKFWIDSLCIDGAGKKHRGEGYIEVLLNQPLYNPFNVEFINQDILKLQPKRIWTRRQKDDPKKRIAKRKPKPLKIRADVLK